MIDASAQTYSIALPNDLPNFSTQVELDGTTYTLSFFWNYEDDAVGAGRWTMAIGQADGTPILSGIGVVVTFAIGQRFVASLAGMPPGALWFEDTTGAGLDPGLNDLGSRVVLYYHNALQVAALAAA